MYRIVLVALAVFALSAVTASAALAAPEWFVKTGGKASKLTSSLGVKATTNLTVEDSAWNSGTKISCKGTMEGTLEPSGIGKISAYVATGCENVKNCPGPYTVESLNLPWKTELYTGGETGAKIRLVSGGSGTPGWRFTCETIIGKTEDQCNFNTSARLSNAAFGNVEAEFNASETARTSCSLGGAEAGVLRGTIAIAHPASVEAIEARGGLPEWRQAGAALTQPVAVTWKGTVKTSANNKTGGSYAVECTDTGEGMVEPGAAGTQTKWTMSNCKAIQGACESKASGSLEALNLPWNTTLTVLGGVTRNLITNSGGTAGFKIKCTNSVLGETSIQCKGTFNTAMENATAGVTARLAPGKMECDLLELEGKVEGTQTIEATKGGKLEVT